ncbi:MAG: hypothetical protein U0166_14355 [Acidobacteriota bacterium]
MPDPPDGSTRLPLLARWADAVLGPIERALLRALPIADPWETFPARVPPRVLGAGGLRPFSWYLDGPSVVEVASVDEICDWLAGCESVTDRELFGEEDHWQHPSELEQLRKGDCEDHALWAWRKLLGLGFDARFVGGSWLPDGSEGDWIGLAWFEYLVAGARFLLESQVDRAVMVQPHSLARSHYVPWVSVDRGLKPVMHAGYLLYRRRVRERERSR